MVLYCFTAGLQVAQNSSVRMCGLILISFFSSFFLNYNLFFLSIVPLFLRELSFGKNHDELTQLGQCLFSFCFMMLLFSVKTEKVMQAYTSLYSKFFINQMGQGRI